MGLFQGDPLLPVAKTPFPVGFWCTDQAEGEIRGLVHRLDLLMILHLPAVEGKTGSGSRKSFACRNLWDTVASSVLCRSPKKLWFREAILIINYGKNKP